MTLIRTIPETISQTWSQYKRQSTALLKISFVYFIVNNLGLVNTFFGTTDKLWSGLINLFLILFSAVLNAWIWIALVQQVANGTNSFEKNLFSNALDKTWKYFVFSLFASLNFIGGLFLLIIPGVLIAFWISFVDFLIILENKGIFQSIYESRNFFRGRAWLLFNRLFVVIIPYLVLFALSSLVSLNSNGLILGLLVSLLYVPILPFVTIYTYLIYKDIKTSWTNDSHGSAGTNLVFVLSTITGIVVLLLIAVGSFI